MSLADALKQLTQPERRPSSIDGWIDTLDTDDRDALYALADDPAVSTNAIRTVIAAHGSPTQNWQTVTDWRRRHGYTR